MAVVSSKLADHTNDNHVLATSHKDTAFTWGSENYAVLAVINVDIGSHVKDKVKASFAVVDIELLPFERIDKLYFELVFFVFEKEVFRIEFFLE